MAQRRFCACRSDDGAVGASALAASSTSDGTRWAVTLQEPAPVGSGARVTALHVRCFMDLQRGGGHGGLRRQHPGEHTAATSAQVLSGPSQHHSLCPLMDGCQGLGRTAYYLRRLTCPNGVIASYLHASPQAGLGKMGALVALVAGRGEGALEGAAARKAQVQPRSRSLSCAHARAPGVEEPRRQLPVWCGAGSGLKGGDACSGSEAPLPRQAQRA